MSFIFDLVLILKVLLKNIFKIKRILKIQYTLVTASDEKHFQYLKNFINYYQSIKNNKFERLIIYDLGLSKFQFEELESNKLVEIRRFPFEDYPKFYGKRLVEHKNKIGGFAWKPEIINLLRNEKINNIIWLDSATFFKKNLLLFKIFIHEYGFASFQSTGTIKQWTHPLVLKELYSEINENILRSSNLMAGVIGFDFNRHFATELHSRWNELSSKEEMIFPEKSTSSTHRHDQSLLSLSYWKLSDKKLPKNTIFFGIKIQNWPNRILFFFDENYGLTEKLLKEHQFNATTTDKRSKIIILFDLDSLQKIPLRLIFTKKVMLFLFDEIDESLISKYFFRKRFIDVIFIKTEKSLKNIDKNAENLKYIEVNQIIKEEYRIMTNE
jgi:hypothetical protein